MTDVKLTTPQSRALQAVADDEVTFHYPWGKGQPYFRAPKGIGKAVLTRLIDARLAKVGAPRGQSYYSARPVLLTDAGREAAESTRKEQG